MLRNRPRAGVDARPSASGLSGPTRAARQRRRQRCAARAPRRTCWRFALRRRPARAWPLPATGRGATTKRPGARGARRAAVDRRRRHDEALGAPGAHACGAWRDVRRGARRRGRRRSTCAGRLEAPERRGRGRCAAWRSLQRLVGDGRRSGAGASARCRVAACRRTFRSRATPRAHACSRSSSGPRARLRRARRVAVGAFALRQARAAACRPLLRLADRGRLRHGLAERSRGSSGQSLGAARSLDLEVLLDLAHTAPRRCARRSRRSAPAAASGCAPPPSQIVTAPRPAHARARRPAVARRPALWPSARSAASGAGVPLGPSVEPCQAAEPIRYGGELIGASRRAGRRAPCSTRAAPRHCSASAALAAARTCARCSIARLCQSRRRGGGRSARRQRTRAHASRRHRARRARAVPGADRRGERQRQGARRARDAPARPAARSPVLRAQLRGAVRRADRGRAVRPRARRVHRRGGRARRPLRGGRRRHAVPRRGRRAVGARAGQAAARAPGRRSPPCRRERAAPRRRADRRRHQPAARARKWRPAGSAPTCASGSTWSASPCRRCAIARDDIPVLAPHFWAEAAARVGHAATLTPEALAALARYDWPGNVRELQNVIASLAVHAPRRGPRLPRRCCRAHDRASRRRAGGGTFEAARAEFERRVRAGRARAGRRPARRRPRGRSASRGRGCQDACGGCGLDAEADRAERSAGTRTLSDILDSSHAALPRSAAAARRFRCCSASRRSSSR